MQLAFEEVGIKGKYLKFKSLRINDLLYVIYGLFIKKVQLAEEDYGDVTDPEHIINTLKGLKNRPDILTFWQRLPDIQPKYKYYLEYESIAALPVHTYQEWIKNQVSENAKRAIEKARKKKVEIKLVEFNSDFINGMVEIFNESPVRQGKQFWHYGKDHGTIEKEFSKFLFREDLIGAYFEGKLIGFIFLSNTGKYAIPTQILSMMSHRDKGVPNALMAKAVEICEQKKIPYIVYGDWQDSSLTEFKRRNGFKKIDMPRYYIPLTLKGRIALGLKLHRKKPHQGFSYLLPDYLRLRLIKLRNKLYGLKSKK